MSKNNLISVFLNSPLKLYRGILQYFKKSKLARILLFIVIIKLAIFYGFFKKYYFPKYMNPKWKSEQQRIEYTKETIIKNHKSNRHD